MSYGLCCTILGHVFVWKLGIFLNYLMNAVMDIDWTIVVDLELHLNDAAVLADQSG